MTENTAFSSIRASSNNARSFFTGARATLAAGFVVAALLTVTLDARAQDASAQAGSSQAAATPAAAASDAAMQAAASDIVIGNRKHAKKQKKKKDKADKVIESKDTRAADKRAKKVNPVAEQAAKLPDQELYDKAQDAAKHGHYDLARLEYQDLLNTYQESQYLMLAKLGIANSWFEEGGVTALVQAEQEYKDFITFFPNSPEAAEAQMRVGDIYYRQMDKPDRDDADTVQAEQAYRLMLQQFPDSTLVPQARQRLRDVQESLASREADVASFYASRMNWSAAIARYQTVVDTYPLYSHMDDVLIGLGDAYEAESQGTRATALPEAAKATLERIDDDQAAADYREVVLEHSAAPHVEDAKDRLVSMGLPVPTPTPAQVAASEALENSRGQYTLSSRVELLVLHKADTVHAATMGDPPLVDAKPILAPTVYNQTIEEYREAMNPATHAPRVANSPLSASVPAAASEANAPGAATPLVLQDVPTSAAGGGSPVVATSVPEATPASASSGNSMGIEIVQPSPGEPGASASTPASSSPPAFPGSQTSQPAAGNSAQPNYDNGELKPVGPSDATALPPIEKAATAPDPINDVAPGSQPPAQVAPANGKKVKPAFDKADESSSKHKKKKGIAKMNPF